MWWGERRGVAAGGRDDKLRDEAIHCRYAVPWIASRSLSSGAHSRDPVARNDGRIALATASREAAVLRPALPAARTAPCSLRRQAKLAPAASSRARAPTPSARLIRSWAGNR